MLHATDREIINDAGVVKATYETDISSGIYVLDSRENYENRSLMGWAILRAVFDDAVRREVPTLEVNPDTGLWHWAQLLITSTSATYKDYKIDVEGLAEDTWAQAFGISRVVGGSRVRARMPIRDMRELDMINELLAKYRGEFDVYNGAVLLFQGGDFEKTATLSSFKKAMFGTTPVICMGHMLTDQTNLAKHDRNGGKTIVEKFTHYMKMMDVHLTGLDDVRPTGEWLIDRILSAAQGGVYPPLWVAKNILKVLGFAGMRVGESVKVFDERAFRPLYALEAIPGKDGIWEIYYDRGMGWQPSRLNADEGLSAS